MTLAEAEAEFVTDGFYAESTTRRDLWNGFGSYLARFVALEVRYAADLAGQPLVPFAWLAGSFVSATQDPRNVDVTVAVSTHGRRRLRGRAGAGWLTDAFARTSTEASFGVTALELPYTVVPSVFRSHRLSLPEQEYLRERGAWDDWWQRLRNPALANAAPSAQTAGAARGYVEVVL